MEYGELSEKQHRVMEELFTSWCTNTTWLTSPTTTPTGFTGETTGGSYQHSTTTHEVMYNKTASNIATTPTRYNYQATLKTTNIIPTKTSTLGVKPFNLSPNSSLKTSYDPDNCLNCNLGLNQDQKTSCHELSVYQGLVIICLCLIIFLLIICNCGSFLASIKAIYPRKIRSITPETVLVNSHV